MAIAGDREALARQVDVQALAVQTDDARAQVLEEVKQLARTADAQFQQLWNFVSNPPADASVPLLQEVIAVLRPPPASRSWWVRYRWHAACVVSGLLVGGGGAWWLARTPADVTRWAQVGWTVDKVLVDQYAGLTKPAQEAVQTVYRQLSLPSPAERKGKR